MIVWPPTTSRIHNIACYLQSSLFVIYSILLTSFPVVSPTSVPRMFYSALRHSNKRPWVRGCFHPWLKERPKLKVFVGRVLIPQKKIFSCSYQITLATFVSLLTKISHKNQELKDCSPYKMSQPHNIVAFQRSASRIESLAVLRYTVADKDRRRQVKTSTKTIWRKTRFNRHG